MSVDGEIDAEWHAYIEARREEELDAIISEQNLKPSRPAGDRDGFVISDSLFETDVRGSLSVLDA